jgi:23S rRNA (adenine2503-C2)-methyltransferase
MRQGPFPQRKVPATDAPQRGNTPHASPQFFFDWTRNELGEFFDRPFRPTQLYEAVYKHGVDDIEQITSFPKSVRVTLGSKLDIRVPPIQSTFEADDGTRRHLIRLFDGELVETVFIPDGNRKTICVSSQVGCGLACAFCLTGQLGFGRHLTAGEIVSQVVGAQRVNLSGEARNHFNIVFMGMGEPLHNYENVMKSLAILNDPAGLNISMSRVTLSTVGLIPELERLSREPRIPNLAVSLTGATDLKRDALMPINRTYPIEDLIRVLARFPRRNRQPITLEYVLLRGLTDSASDARNLANIARNARAKVNLIPLNESHDLRFKRPDPQTIAAFQSTLRQHGVRAFVRKSRGDDIAAACGQLKKRWADEPAASDLGVLGR